MLETILSAFKSGIGFPHVMSMFNAVNTLLLHFGEDYAKDANARNAAIDALCELLQSQKTP